MPIVAYLGNLHTEVKDRLDRNGISVMKKLPSGDRGIKHHYDLLVVDSLTSVEEFSSVEKVVYVGDNQLEALDLGAVGAVLPNSPRLIASYINSVLLSPIHIISKSYHIDVKEKFLKERLGKTETIIFQTLLDAQGEYINSVDILKRLKPDLAIALDWKNRESAESVLRFYLTRIRKKMHEPHRLIRIRPCKLRLEIN